MKRSFIATFLGLVSGYVVFFAGVTLLILFEMVTGDSEYSNTSAFLMFWLVLFIPIGVGWPFLSLIVVWPTANLLDSLKTDRVTSILVGGLIGGGAGLFILHALGVVGGSGSVLFQAREWWCAFAVPMISSTVAGTVTAERLLKLRKESP